MTRSETVGDHVRRLWRRGNVSLFVAPWPITVTNPPRDAWAGSRSR